MEPNPAPTPAGRREFLKLVGLAGLTTTLAAPAKAMAQAAKSMTAPADTAKAAAPAAPEPPSDDAKALASIIQRRYGKYLDNDQMKDVTDELDGRIKSGQALRAVKLANGDEPDFRFKA